jgi:Xaa-Pro aminopeptidase
MSPASAFDAASSDLLARELADRGCEALLVVAGSARDPDIAPFVGPVHLGRAFLILPRPDRPGRGSTAVPALGYLTAMERGEASRTGLKLLAPADLEVERLSRELAEPGAFWGAVLAKGLEIAGVPPGRLALAGHPGAGLAVAFSRRLEATGRPAVDGHEVVRLLRKRKGPADLEDLRRAAAMPHSIGTDERVLRAGESLVADIFPRSRLFADCTRTFCVGEPPEALARAHGAVLRALRKARRGARPGARGWSLQEATCALLGELGYETPISHPGTERGYVHNLGHGVGYELHEYPSFRKEAGAEGALAAGDVITLEPGLYSVEERYGVRLEDLVVLGEDGIVEDLTPLPYGLDPQSW